jgi:hypothetical protein
MSFWQHRLTQEELVFHQGWGLNKSNINRLNSKPFVWQRQWCKGKPRKLSARLSFFVLIAKYINHSFSRHSSLKIQNTTFKTTTPP